MLVRNLQNYIDAVSDKSDIGIAIHSIETGREIAVVYATAVEINEYGELIIKVEI